MLHGLLIASLVYTCAQSIKHAMTPTIPSENWANKDLMRKDLLNGVSVKEQVKLAESGRYKVKDVYPEPHRDKDGKIIIENCLLYNKDLAEYGAVQTMKWVDQGKYNLTPEKLKVERERIMKELEYLYKKKI